MSAETSTTVLNLTDNSVTKEQYETAITALGTEMCNIAYEKEWCSARHQYFRAIFSEYNRDNLLPNRDYEPHPDQRPPFQADFSQTPDTDNYGYTLSVVRAHILWYVRSGTVDLDRANQVFRAMNIPTYPDKPQTGGRLLRVYLSPFYVRVSESLGTEYESEDWAVHHLAGVLQAMLNGQPVADNPLIPGAFQIEGYSEAYVQRPGIEPVMPEDTIRPGLVRE